jgi:hypothetical protein
MGYVIAVILGILWIGDLGADNSFFLTAAGLCAIAEAISMHK